MKQKMRPLDKKLDLATYAKDKIVQILWINSSDGMDRSDSEVSVPLPIMYRLYHLGRAYDLHQLKNLHPNGAISLDYIASQLLAQELGQLVEIVADPVLAYYSGQLLTLMNANRGSTKGGLVIKC